MILSEEEQKQINGEMEKIKNAIEIRDITDETQNSIDSINKQIEEIKNKINENNEKIEKASKPFIFTLNKTIQVLMAENEKLREKCPHEFDT